MAKEPNSHLTPSPVRDRLIDAADRLFYSEGVRAVSVDRVLDEAEAAKASLYAHFGCKDKLVAAYVQRRVDVCRARLEATMADVPPADRALHLFDWVVEQTQQPDFRGCPVMHVVSELADARHPARVVAAEQRTWMHRQLVTWARAAGAADPQRVAGALQVLLDGAVAAAEQDGPQRAHDARWLAEQLLSQGGAAAAGRPAPGSGH
jgi:AcrR family transcriptional regulator